MIGGTLVAFAALAIGRGFFAQDSLPEPRLRFDQDPAPVAEKKGPDGQEPGPLEVDDEASLYPIPAIGVTKNEGASYGLLLALLLPDPEGRISKIISAQMAWRSYIGINGSLDFRYSINPKSTFELFSYWAQKTEHLNFLFFEDRDFMGQHDFHFEFDERRIATERYFGQGIGTPESQHSIYTSNCISELLRFGPNLSDELALQLTLRGRKLNVRRSTVGILPQTLNQFPTEFGIDGGWIVGEGVRLRYDSRDNFYTPTQGEYGILFAEMAHFFNKGIATPFQIFGLEGSKLWPMDDEADFVTVAHLKLQFITGHPPFWELSGLGGGNSLRSFGINRFTENNSWVFNLEERIRLFMVRVEGVTGEVQLAPFFDLGEVFHAPQDLFRGDIPRRIHFSYGAGFRAVVHPYIVGRVDLAFGPEGMGITVALDYPF